MMINLFIIPKEDLDILRANMGWYCDNCGFRTTLADLRYEVYKTVMESQDKRLPKCPDCGKIEWAYGIRPVIAKQSD